MIKLPSQSNGVGKTFVATNKVGFCFPSSIYLEREEIPDGYYVKEDTVKSIKVGSYPKENPPERNIEGLRVYYIEIFLHFGGDRYELLKYEEFGFDEMPTNLQELFNLLKDL